MELVDASRLKVNESQEMPNADPDTIQVTDEDYQTSSTRMVSENIYHKVRHNCQRL